MDATTTPDHETAAPGSRRPALDRVHRQRGGVLRPLAALGEVVAHYGDAAAEHAALTTATAVLERSWAERLEMTGPDRSRFLGGLVTCAVQDLAAGEGTYGFLTSSKGKILADLVILATGDRFLLEAPPGRGAAVREHVLKYRIADRVELEPLPGAVVLTVAGPGAEALLAGLTQGADALPSAGWQHRVVRLAGHEVRALRHGLAPVPGFDLWTQAAGAAEVFAALEAAGARPAGFDAWEAARVEAGLPRFGPDFGEDNLPQETGLEAVAVSYDKGCYLGQEIVARIHYRGGVNKGLRGLDLGALKGEARGAEPGSVAKAAEAALPAPGTRVLFEGRAAGHLGTAVVSPRLGRAVALAILHQRAGDAGTEVEVEGTGPAMVRELPFAPAGS